MPRYQLHEEIGRGAMGVVYRATQVQLDRIVALKLLALDALDDPALVQRFQTEAQALGSLDHPHIIKVLDTGRLDGRPFMAMELIDGHDLQALRDQRGPQSVDTVLGWLLQLTDALALIHERGLIHRDVKPTNILISRSGHITLMDFGLVKTRNAPMLTEPGTVVGTPRYFAPEAVVGDSPSPALDMFALALTAHEMLTGKPWCAAGDAEIVMQRILIGPLPDLAKSHPHAPKWFVQAQAAALKADPAQRLTAVQYLDVLRRNGVRASLPPPLEPLASVTPLSLSRSAFAPDGYTLGAEIGAGAMGMVFRATQVALNREVALKVMRPGMGTTGSFRERFQREAMAMSKVSHPSLIKVFDVGAAGDQPYIAMELVPGRTLEAAAAASPVEVRRRADALFEQIVEAVAVMHAKSLNHRDLKPGNVMLTPDYKPVVMDLGLVKDVAGDGTVLTRTGALLGTPAFLPPEVLSGGPFTARADVWALGCIYFHLFAGRPPFASETVAGLYRAILAVDLPDFDSTAPDMSPAARTFTLRLMSKVPEDRPRDARAVLTEFRAMKNGAGLRARRPSGSISRPPGIPGATSGAGAQALSGARRGIALAALLAACAGGAYLYTPRPPSTPGPAPSRAAPSVDPSAGWREIDTALRGIGAPQLHQELCSALGRRRAKMKERRAVEASLRTEWTVKITSAIDRAQLRRHIEASRRDPSLAQTDDFLKRYRLVADLEALMGQLAELGVEVTLDLAPLYPPLHRPWLICPPVHAEISAAEWQAVSKYQTDLAKTLADGETIGLRFTEGYGYVPTVPKKTRIAYQQGGHPVHFWSKVGGEWWGQDAAEVGMVDERLSYVCRGPLPFRPVAQGERMLFEIGLRGLSPTERFTFHTSRDGAHFSAPILSVTGTSDRSARTHHHWIDPSLIMEPLFIRIDYHHCESVTPTGNVLVLWMLVHYVKQPAPR